LPTSAELRYLFGHLIPAEHYDDVDARMSETIEHAWTEFAPVCRVGPMRHPATRAAHDSR
jgi:hypothetical protein